MTTPTILALAAVGTGYAVITVGLLRFLARITRETGARLDQIAADLNAERAGVFAQTPHSHREGPGEGRWGEEDHGQANYIITGAE
jgi:hypothetical protein